VKIRLHGTEDECREMAEQLRQIMTVQAVSEPYPDRGRSVLVRVYVEGTPRGLEKSEAADVTYAKLHPDPYASWVNGKPPAPELQPRLRRIRPEPERPSGACCERAVYDDSAGWWCCEHGNLGGAP
jgi:hypothetical protein